MKLIKIIPALLYITIFTPYAFSQQLMRYQEPKEYTMPPKSIPTPRKYWVSLPKNYDESNVSYPIIFVFDGDEAYLRNLVLSTADNLSNFIEMPPCIIVGLIQRNRSLDFGPLYAVKTNPNSSKVNGDKFFDFLKFELLPELKKNYRIQDFRLGVGHSLGGLFLTYCLTKDPSFFNGIIAISPALELKRDSTIFAHLKTTLNTKLTRHIFYAWASGTEGVNEIAFKPGSLALNKLLSQNRNPSFNYKYIDLPGENHNTTPIFSMPQAMAFVFKSWNLGTWNRALFVNTTNPEQVYLERKSKMKNLYGFDEDPIEYNIQSNVAGQLYTMKQYAKAIPYIEKAIQIDSLSAGYYMQLGEIHEKLKNYPAAEKNMKLAINKLNKTQEGYDDILADYEKNLKRVEELSKTQ